MVALATLMLASTFSEHIILRLTNNECQHEQNE